ncbi:NADPH-dependent conjugated polyketone reductase C1 [Cytospora mali]|uniref:NADPH-dependent conjugated polyketone reductase C1 n=1 Tax=Cytospora mali TaxID=578113 RepID=A0A194UPR3_CYTMA|nr:NADPH-dependent conjugated polyketone reductase C1 [Valsa mali var. pyri (nom. inval.)]
MGFANYQSSDQLGYGTGTAHIRGKLASTSSFVLTSSDIIDRNIVDNIKLAIRAGYRHLDTAEMYQTEGELGTAIKEVVDEGVVKREDLFVTTKISSEFALAEKKIDISLKKLGLDYVDLYLVHTPYLKGPDADLRTAWVHMQAVKASGKARSIGVSNYEESHLAGTLAGIATGTVPSINQIEFHPYMQHRGLTEFSKSCADGRGITVSAYGAMHPVTRNPNPGGPLDQTLERVAASHGVTVGLVCLRWCIDQGVVVITTTLKEERMKEYLRVFDLKLSEAEVKDISDAGTRSLHNGEELVPRAVQYHRKLAAQKEAKEVS